MNKPKVIVIVGPTATSKTSLAIKLAKEFNGEIINGDAFQVYKELNIGVNKPTKQQLSKVKFHLIDELSINEEWDIKKFQHLGNKKIKEILDHKHLPIVCGGSSLYIDALVKNYDLDNIPKRSNEFDHLSADELYQQLSKYSLETANKNKGNHKRLARALEIYSNDQSDDLMKKTNKQIYDFKIILTSFESRNELYEKINKRVEQMLELGWIKEVKQFLDYPNILNLNSFKAIGYREIYHSLKTNTELDVDKIKQNTRRYAKRQITWIKNHYHDCLVFNQSNYDEILKELKLWIE